MKIFKCAQTACTLAGHGIRADLTCPLLSCGDSTRIDTDWHRRNLMDGLLTHWLEVTPADTELMRTAIDRQWKPNLQQPGYLTEHARLVYAMIIGHLSERIGYSMTLSMEFFSQRLRDPTLNRYNIT